MNTAILRLADRHHSGCRYWMVPGFMNNASLIPGSLTGPGWGAAVRWPAFDQRGSECIKGVDLDRHRTLAKAEIRKMIANCATAR